MQNNKKRVKEVFTQQQKANSQFVFQKLDVVRKGKYEYYSTNRRPYDQRLKCQRT